jgi:predicted DNA-binding antitoxin AbrB/MazE fold protein
MCYDRKRSAMPAGYNQRGGSMEKTIRARYREGLIEPLEKLELEEGEEVEITVSCLPPAVRAKEAIKATSGAWREAVDCDGLIRDIYETRRLSAARPEVRL